MTLHFMQNLLKEYIEQIVEIKFNEDAEDTCCNYKENKSKENT